MTNDEQQEYYIRQEALNCALRSCSPGGLTQDEIMSRAESNYKFLKGEKQ